MRILPQILIPGGPSFGVQTTPRPSRRHGSHFSGLPFLLGRGLNAACPVLGLDARTPHYIIGPMSGDAEPAPKVLEDLIARASAAGASDIHLQMHSEEAELSLRLDGVMTSLESIPRDLAERVFGRIKFLSRLKTYQESLPQDGRIDAASVGSASDIRVATYPTVTGEKIVLRLFTETAVIPLGELGFPSPAVDEMEGVLSRGAGMMLLTGPAGSGKTTTIYACLERLASDGGRHIISVEDPVERILQGVMQTEINEARGLDFATAARHLMRQDPEVIVIGEIRDGETAAVAVRAALTGHMVISTLHAGSCRGVFERLLVICEDRDAAISSLEFVINQRLVRRLCSACSGSGCPACLSTGYHGRLPVVEWLRVEDGHRRSARSGDLDAIRPAAVLADAARDLVAAGLTGESECQRVFGWAEK